MRLGVAYQRGISPYYRAIGPMEAMERRGHEVLWPDSDGKSNAQLLAECDVVHVYRLAGDEIQRVLAGIVRAGAVITYDNDDNRAALSSAEGKFVRKDRSRLEGQHVHASTVKIARMASTFTTTTEELADVYRKAGVEHIAVIDNGLAPDVDRSRTRHDGVVVGWVAGMAHQADIAPLRIDVVLKRLMDEHPDVRVECIGADLRLPERYRHDGWLPFEALPQRIGGFDVGIAPLVDNAVNRVRSDIKVKEYAASGVPWLASPVGPYAGLGEEQGGRLVPDDMWFDALDRLVTNKRERRRLGRKAKKWAEGQTIDAFADSWERVFLEVAAKRATSQ